MKQKKIKKAAVLFMLFLFIGFGEAFAENMILEFNTNLSEGTEILLPFRGFVDVIVDWGDGNSEPFTIGGNKHHTYAQEGIYIVDISGSLGVFGNGDSPYYIGVDKIVRVTDFGDLGLFSLYGAFNGATNLIEVPATLPSTVTSLSYTFCNAISLNQDISNWDVSNVTNMAAMFCYARTFNQDISSWDVSNVGNMMYMFLYANVFNQDIGSWNVSNVASMSWMFSYARDFNHDIGNWDVSNVHNMSYMYYNANSFNQDIGDWDVSNVTNMKWMFTKDYVFNQDIGDWDVSNVYDMEDMFYDANAFNYDIGGWDVSNVEDMTGMFYSALYSTPFNQDISGWDVGNVIYMDWMFGNASSFNQDIGDWDVSNVITMWHLFENATSFDQDIGNWDVSSVQNFDAIFLGASSFNQNIGGWDLSSALYTGEMFEDASSFNQDLSNWDVSNVINMAQMFKGATSFDQNIGGWDVSNVAIMTDMFRSISLSSENYNSLLIGWSELPLQNNVEFSGGNSTYNSAEAVISREIMVTDFNWIIDDGGYVSTITIDNLQPKSTKLIGNYPNPFNPATTISFNLTAEDAENTELRIFNLKGQKVKTFTNLQITQSPNQQVTWNGKDENGNAVSSGVYLYKLKSDRYSSTKKMILLK